MSRPKPTHPKFLSQNPTGPLLRKCTILSFRFHLILRATTYTITLEAALLSRFLSYLRVAYGYLTFHVLHYWSMDPTQPNPTQGLAIPMSHSAPFIGRCSYPFSNGCSSVLELSAAASLSCFINRLVPSGT